MRDLRLDRRPGLSRRLAALAWRGAALAGVLGAMSASAPSGWAQAPAGTQAPPLGGEPTRGEWGDQGDGTFANPVMPADVSDLDAIRVGSDYYAISSTFQYSPGMVVLHSRDLVNWKIVGHVVDDLTRIGPELNWDRMNRPGRGIWAGAIRHHAGRYWVYFGAPDEGFFMSTATDPRGPWTPLEPVWRVSGWNDPCPFWDADGRMYLIATHFQRDSTNGKSYNIHLFELSADGKRILPGTDRIVHQSQGSEASKLFTHQGRYYHFYSEVKPEGRVVMMGRAPSLAGPWERRQLMHVRGAVDKEPNQGGMIELPDGRWYFVTHQGKGDWEGRAGVLLPITWVDGWPVPGAIGEDGIGNMLWRGRKPIAGAPRTRLVASDDFGGRTLKPEWEWNYQPRAGFWSLTERPGHLRLRAFPRLRAGEFATTGNVLTQRSLRTKRNEITVHLDLSGLVDGQEAGIAHYSRTSCTIAVVQAGGVRRLTSTCGGVRTEGPIVRARRLRLRSTWGFDGRSRFSYSEAGHAFTPFGDEYQLGWGHYRGDRIGIFTANDAGAARGVLDVDAVEYRVQD